MRFELKVLFLPFGVLAGQKDMFKNKTQKSIDLYKIFRNNAQIKIKKFMYNAYGILLNKCYTNFVEKTEYQNG